jgi:hypothetical protein
MNTLCRPHPDPLPEGGHLLGHALQNGSVHPRVCSLGDAASDHLKQPTPMGRVIKVRCVHPTRFWVEDGLLGAFTSDEGEIKTTALTGISRGGL